MFAPWPPLDPAPSEDILADHPDKGFQLITAPQHEATAFEKCSCVGRIQTCRSHLAVLQAAARNRLLAPRQQVLNALAMELMGLLRWHESRHDGGLCPLQKRARTQVQENLLPALSDIALVLKESLNLVSQGLPIDGQVQQLYQLQSRWCIRATASWESPSAPE